MVCWISTISRAAVSGAFASAASTVALAVLARSEQRGALQPVNATSHWLHGESAADVKRADLAHTAVGYATHHAACWFWAVLFEWWMGSRRQVRGLPVFRNAAIMSAAAATVDYTITPKRFTPGWELVLSKRAMAVAYAAMGLGSAAGALLNRR